MPEAREGMNQGRETTRDITGGFFIRRASYQAGMAGSRSRRVQSWVVTTDNKENIPPSQAVTARRRARNRKSPLPNWYPRTPLRDITVIVNALERRRMRARAARVQGNNPNHSEASSMISPVAEERNAASDTPASQALPSDVSDHTPATQALPSDTSPSPAAASLSFLSPIEHPLHAPSSSSNSFSPLEQPTGSVTVSANPSSTKVVKPTEFEKKLQSTIAEMEKLVLENLKRSPKPPAKKATRALMSMR